ncbi:hypothetical protein GCM10010911_03310 [Paenibacillus nasutitermitis]|uniref:Uncharacterized protein n=1 Tax=Paenibacillus nasutitermitis TaxID=1652958 RepID=A0A916YKJ5_9BACL|nr:hypothetical protein GCM10010911_03310 [Paenibacillus nasutitermitis]
MGLSTTHQGVALTMKYKQSDAQNHRLNELPPHISKEVKQ